MKTVILGFFVILAGFVHGKPASPRFIQHKEPAGFGPKVAFSKIEAVYSCVQPKS